MKNIKPFHFLLIWVFGFFALLSFDLFMEGIVFKWLEWNGTTKNDWFFVLWWGFVVVWLVYGIITLHKKISPQILRMKITDTIIGSIIIGVLVGGAILLSGGNGNDEKNAQIKILTSPSGAEGGKGIIHKELNLDKDSKSEIKIHINSDEITEGLPSDIADTVETALSEALQALPEDIDIKIEIKANQ